MELNKKIQFINNKKNEKKNFFCGVFLSARTVGMTGRVVDGKLDRSGLGDRRLTRKE